MKKPEKPRILILDIETRPLIGFSWQYYMRSGGTLIDILADDGILCHVSKWLGEKKLMVSRIDKKKGYKPFLEYTKDGFIWNSNSKAEKEVALDVWKLLDEADIVIGQNVKKFDIKKMNTLFELYELGPPSSYQTYDTLTVSRSTFGMARHNLDYRNKRFGGEGKLEHEGWRMWLRYLEGDRKMANKMIKYNKRDVLLSERDYLRLRKWGKHPNLNVYMEDKAPKCSRCLGTNLERRGFAYTNQGKYQEYRCKTPGCGGHAKGTRNLASIPIDDRRISI